MAHKLRKKLSPIQNYHLIILKFILVTIFFANLSTILYFAESLRENEIIRGIKVTVLNIALLDKIYFFVYIEIQIPFIFLISIIFISK